MNKLQKMILNLICKAVGQNIEKGPKKYLNFDDELLSVLGKMDFWEKYMIWLSGSMISRVSVKNSCYFVVVPDAFYFLAVSVYVLSITI